MILAKTVRAILEYMLVGRSCFCPRLGDRVPSKQGSLFLDSSLLGQPLVLGLETESPPLKQESLSWIPHSSAKLQSLLGDRVPSKQGSLFLDSSLHPPWLGDRVPFSQSRSLRSLSFLAAGMTETDLRCIKCNEEVTLESSHASGRNALRRVCLECSATDRWLQRCRKTKDKKGGESEKEKEARLSAEKVTLSLSKMSSEEKVSWYKKQKEERAENNGHRKRTFETAVGALTEAKKRLESQQDIDRWYRFKDWAAREVLLTGAKPEDLPRLWKSETSKPGAITKVVRGELLLKEWTGCEDRLGSQHEMSASVKQRMDLLAKEDLERFQEISAGRLERGENLLSADRLVNSANNTRQESQLLNEEDPAHQGRPRRDGGGRRGRGGMAGEVLPRTPGREEAQEGAEVQVPGLPDEGGRGGPKRLPERRRCPEEGDETGDGAPAPAAGAGSPSEHHQH